MLGFFWGGVIKVILVMQIVLVGTGAEQYFECYRSPVLLCTVDCLFQGLYTMVHYDVSCLIIQAISSTIEDLSC